MFGFTSIRSTEFYVIILIIILFCYLKANEMDLSNKHINHTHPNLHLDNFMKNVKSGVVRGAITGAVLGGYPGILPATVLLTFLNVSTNTVTEMIG